MSSVIKVNLKSRKLDVKVKESRFDKNAETVDLREKEEAILKSHIDKAYKEGFEAGSASTAAELTQKFNFELKKKFEMLEAIFGNFEENISEYEIAFDKVVSELSILIAEKIIHREVEFAPILPNILKESLKKVIGANKIIVKLNPGELEMIEADSENLLSKSSLTNLSFEADDRIQKGGCLVLSEIGNVDARVSAQLSEIEKSLEAKYKQTEEV